MKFPQISAVRVKVGKPHVAVRGPVDYLGVDIVRYREDSLEMDDEDDVYISKNTVNPHSAVKEKPDLSFSEWKTFISERVGIEKPPASPESKPATATNFTLNKRADLTARVSDGPNLAGKAVGFTFPTAAPSTPNPPQPSSTSQLPSFLNPPVLAEEKTGFPLFSFDSKSSDKGHTNFTFSSTVSKVSDAFSQNSGAGSDSKPVLLNRMLGGELIVIFHYDGEFKFDMIHPVYEGGKQKMRSIGSDITFPELMDTALETTHWEETCENLSIRYLHHNGHVFSLATIEDDSDIKFMLTLANEKTNGIYLYINRRPMAFATHNRELISNAGTSMTSPVTPPEAIASNKDEKTLEVGNLYRSNDNTVSAGVSTSAIPNIFSLGASTNSSQSNGLLTSSAISISSTSTNVASGSSTGPIFSSSPAATIGSYIPSILATFPTSAPSNFGSGFSSSSPSTTFSFGASTTAGSTPPAFGSSPGASSGSSMFSFTTAAAASSSSTLSLVQPVFGMPNPVGFGSASPGNDQMNVEDSMAEDTVQASTPTAAPAFGLVANTSSSSNFVFGSAAVPAGGSSVFQSGSHQNSSTPRSPSPFTAPGNLEFPSGGSFSLGTGGVDKSNRKFVRARRDKHRKK